MKLLRGKKEYGKAFLNPLIISRRICKVFLCRQIAEDNRAKRIGELRKVGDEV